MIAITTSNSTSVKPRNGRTRRCRIRDWRRKANSLPDVSVVRSHHELSHEIHSLHIRRTQCDRTLAAAPRRATAKIANKHKPIVDGSGTAEPLPPIAAAFGNRSGLSRPKQPALHEKTIAARRQSRSESPAGRVGRCDQRIAT